MHMASKRKWGDVGVGVGTVGLAIVAGWQASLIPAEASYARVGPHVFPWAITVMLGALGAVLAVYSAFSRQVAEPGVADDEYRPALDLHGALFMGLGLLLNVALIDQVGFIISSTLLFVCTARAFKSTSPLRDAAIGFVLAVVSYVGFDRVLGYKIGSGLIESLI